jgi:inhibitor of KinA
MRFAPLGDHAVTITLGDTIDEATHRLVRAVCTTITANRPRGVVELVPAFASVTVHYDPQRIGNAPDRRAYSILVEALERLLEDVRAEDVAPPHVVEIPVCYGGELGPDLEEVASRRGLTAEEVVHIHAAGDYLVYMVGFMAGFAYLGGLDDRIATPRRSTPRKAVPAGTVGIGGNQTGVYPLESPGGWNLIGRTPLRVFDLKREAASLLATGDRVRFQPISLAEFRRWDDAP